MYESPHRVCRDCVIHRTRTWTVSLGPRVTARRLVNFHPIIIRRRTEEEEEEEHRQV